MLKNFYNSQKQLRESVFSSQQSLTLSRRDYTTEYSLKLIMNALFNALYFRSERAEQLCLTFTFYAWMLGVGNYFRLGILNYY